MALLFITVAFFGLAESFWASDISFNPINDEGQFRAYFQQVIDGTDRFLWCTTPDRELLTQFDSRDTFRLIYTVGEAIAGGILAIGNPNCRVCRDRPLHEFMDA